MVGIKIDSGLPYSLSSSGVSGGVESSGSVLVKMGRGHGIGREALGKGFGVGILIAFAVCEK